MRYLIIGLGIYGSNLARDLTDMGHEIIGADNRKTNVEAIKDYISTAYLIDATEESALSMLPLNNVDLVIVAIGENFGASVRVVALLEKMNVAHIYARAVDTLHASILEGLHIDRIITPEQRAAHDLTNENRPRRRVQSMPIDSDNYVMRFQAPAQFVGHTVGDIGLETIYGLKVIAVTRLFTKKNIIGISSLQPKVLTDTPISAIVLAEGDTITCFGDRKSYSKMVKETEKL